MIVYFTLTVIGPFVLSRGPGEPDVIPDHRTAYRWLRAIGARKIAGSDRCLSGLYCYSVGD